MQHAISSDHFAKVEPRTQEKQKPISDTHGKLIKTERVRIMDGRVSCR